MAVLENSVAVMTTVVAIGTYRRRDNEMQHVRVAARSVYSRDDPLNDPELWEYFPVPSYR